MKVELKHIFEVTGASLSTPDISSYLTSSSGKPMVLLSDYKAVVRLCMPNYLRGTK